MADISSQVDLRDPLGAPPSVNRAGYLEALARLGYNMENLNSPLPFATANMNAASSLITNQYQQQLEYQKAQANIQETTARANNLDSVTEYNKKALNLKLQALENEQKTWELQHQLDVNKVARDNATQDTAIRVANLQGTIEQQKADLGKITVDTAEANQKRSQEAQDDLQAAIAGIPLPEDPDYVRKKAQNVTDHLAVMNDPVARDTYNNAVAARDQARAQSDAVIKALANQQELDKHLDEKNLPGIMRGQTARMSFNDELSHRAIVQGNLTRTNKAVGQILGTLNAIAPEDRTDEVKKVISDLTDVSNRVTNILSDDQNGYQNITRGVHTPHLDPDGNLDPQMQGELDALKLYQAELFKRGLAKPEGVKAILRPPTQQEREQGITEPQITYETTVAPGQIGAAVEALKSPEQREQERQAIESGKIIPSGAQLFERIRQGLPEFPWEPIGPGPGAAAATAVTPQPGRQEDIRQGLNALVARRPELRPLLDRAGAGDMVARNRLLQILEGRMTPEAAGAVAGMQYGGMAGTAPGLGKQAGGTIFNPASVTAPLPGTTDTVPAMLTPGEYVVNKDAAQTVGKEFLDSINQMGKGGQRISATPSLNIGQPQPFRPRSATQRQLPQPTEQTPQKVTPWWGDYPPRAEPATTPTEPFQPQTLPTTPARTTISEGGPHISLGPNAIIGSEFGAVDDPARGGYTEAGWNIGKWGADIGSKSAVGVALPASVLRRYGNVDDKNFADNFNSKYHIAVTDPRTGKHVVASLMDLGPGEGQRAKIDLTWGTRAALGLQENSEWPISYDIVPKASYQHGGIVQEEGSIGTGGGRRGGGAAGGGIEAELDQPATMPMRHRRFHPRVGAAGGLGEIAPDIPDPMQKKLARLSQGYLSGINELIRTRPEMGPAILRHARKQLAANMGGEELGATGAEGTQQMRQAAPAIPPEAYGGGMDMYGESSGTQYAQFGGLISARPGFGDPNFLDPLSTMFGGPAQLSATAPQQPPTIMLPDGTMDSMLSLPPQLGFGTTAAMLAQGY
jgi:hypothetical protein